MMFNGIITTKILISIIIITTLFRDQLGSYLNSEIQNQEENTRKEQKRFRCSLGQVSHCARLHLFRQNLGNQELSGHCYKWDERAIWGHQAPNIKQTKKTPKL